MNQNQRLLTFVGLGLLLWLAFLIFIRALGTPVFTVGSPLLMVLFVAAVPLVLVTILAISRVTGVPTNEMLIPIVIMDATALFLDGLAVGFTDLYGPQSNQVAAGAAFLLWGVAVTLVAGLWLSRRSDAS